MRLPPPDVARCGCSSSEVSGPPALQDIASAMGFTKPALYYYFHSKHDLLEALAAPALDRLERLADVGSPPLLRPGVGCSRSC
ncbi:TetR/AcrR family transcriptional regulator [Streptomyces glebosus]